MKDQDIKYKGIEYSCYGDNFDSDGNLQDEPEFVDDSVKFGISSVFVWACMALFFFLMIGSVYNSF